MKFYFILLALFLSANIFSSVSTKSSQNSNDLFNKNLSKHDIKIAKSLSNFYSDLSNPNSLFKDVLKLNLKSVKESSTFSDFHHAFWIFNNKNPKNLATNFSLENCRTKNISENFLISKFNKKIKRFCIKKYLHLLSKKKVVTSEDVYNIIIFKGDLLFSRYENSRIFKALENITSISDSLNLLIKQHFLFGKNKVSLNYLKYIKIDEQLTQYIQNNKLYDRSTKYFNKELKNLITSFKTSFLNGDLEQSRDIFDNTLEFYKQNSRHLNKNKSWQLFITLGKALFRTSNPEFAIEIYQLSESMADDDQHNESIFQTLYTHLTKEDYLSANKFISEKSLISKFSSIDSKLRFWISYSYFKSNEFILAKKLFIDQIELNPLSYYSILSFHFLRKINPDYKSNLFFSKHIDVPSNSFKISEKALRFVSAFSLVRDSLLTEYSLSHLKNSSSHLNKDDRTYLFNKTLAHLTNNKLFLSSFKLSYDLISSNTIPLTTEVLHSLFPLEYFELVSRYSKDLDPYIVLSLIRQESAFNPYARSHVGARGLMQLLPSTAAQYSNRKRLRLSNPTQNVEIGMRYLTKLLKMNDGNLVLALASYNAGEGNVRRWKDKILVNEDPLLMIEAIPFKETRNYVKLIYRNIYFYNFINDNKEFFKTSLRKSVQIQAFND